MTMRSHVVRWRIAPRGAARERASREAVIVEIARPSGVVGYGEAAPLAPGDSIGSVLRFFEDPTVASPSARFALETAVLDARAKERGVPLAALLRAEATGEPRAALPVAAVVDTVAEASATAARCLKIKVGRDGDLERVRAIASAAPHATIRIDANRTWPRDTVVDRMRALTDLPIEFVEEPCVDAHELLDADLPLRIALDESLAAFPVVRGKQLAAIVLKPTLLGGLAACRALAARAREHGVAAIVTHALEGPTGTAACAALALSLDTRAAVGLAAHPALEAWDTAVPHLDATHVRAHDAPGLGLDTGTLEDDLVALGDPLSPRTAARVAPMRVRTLASRERCLVATPSHDTIAAIHAALDERRPIALLHPRATDAEHARQRALVSGAALDEGDVVLFTSGSTGPARGVVLSRDALIAATEASAAHLGWHDDDRWLLALPMAHAGGLAVVVRCLAARRELVLAAESSELPLRLAECTLASLVPAQLAALLDDPRWVPPPRLRAVLLGGAAAPPALLARAAERGVPFLRTYGLTETFGQIATAPVERAGHPLAPLVPLAHAAIEAGTRARPDRIRVRSPALARRYLDGEPIAPALATNDLGYLEDNTLVVVGRADDMIITGGENVHPQLVEAVLAATPGVRAACAFGIADERWGQRVVAALAVDASFELPRAIERWRASLPPHARPREIATVRELPLSPNGKLDRRAATALPRVSLG